MVPGSGASGEAGRSRVGCASQQHGRWALLLALLLACEQAAGQAAPAESSSIPTRWVRGRLSCGACTSMLASSNPWAHMKFHHWFHREVVHGGPQEVLPSFGPRHPTLLCMITSAFTGTLIGSAVLHARSRGGAAALPGSTVGLPRTSTGKGGSEKQGCASCPTTLDPVCGDDAVEYANACIATCQGVSIVVSLAGDMPVSIMCSHGLCSYSRKPTTGWCGDAFKAGASCNLFDHLPRLILCLTWPRFNQPTHAGGWRLRPQRTSRRGRCVKQCSAGGGTILHSPLFRPCQQGKQHQCSWPVKGWQLCGSSSRRPCRWLGGGQLCHHDIDGLPRLPLCWPGRCGSWCK